MSDHKIHDLDMLSCPHYQGVGTCKNSGLCLDVGEPVCQAMEPEEGWNAAGRTPEQIRQLAIEREAGEW